ncbi:MAG TPA: CpXC domain-containing protein [Anaerolineaceae bacterium]
MPKTQVSCPRCRKPAIVDLQQLFDVGSEPEAKQRFLSGSFNLLQCKNCGYEGPYSVPLVYHDPDKELLLTFFPPELGLPVNEQERLVGPLITQAVNKLAPEKRKAYLFRPQTMLTLQTMIERVLEADGITKEMIDASQKRLNLLQRLLTATAEQRPAIIQEEQAVVDEEFFGILSRLIQGSLAQGDQRSAQTLAALQNEILPLTEVGRRIQSESKEANAAIRALQEASKKGLTRESLLDLFAAATSDIYLTTMIGLVRSGMDYSFYQILAERIDKAEGEEKEKLSRLRTRLLEISDEVDARLKESKAESLQVLDKLLAEKDIEAATRQALNQMDQLFVDVLQDEVNAAQKNGDLDRFNKLQKVVNVIQEASAPPPEYELVESLLRAEDNATLDRLFSENSDAITSEFLDFINGLISQMQAQKEGAEIAGKLEAIYNRALRFSMQKNLQ